LLPAASFCIESSECLILRRGRFVFAPHPSSQWNASCESSIATGFRIRSWPRGAEVVMSPLLLSVKLAAVTSVLLLALGLPLAYWLAFTRFRLRFLVESVVAMPIVLPPTVLGFYLLLLLGARGSLGAFWERLTGHTLAFSFEGLVVGSVIYSLPFAVQPFTAALVAVDRRLLTASASLGASDWRTFWRILLPLALPGIVTGVALSFAHTLGEFGVVLMLGGNIPGQTRTASIAIYDNVQMLDYAAAAHQSIVLLSISFALLVLINALQRRTHWSIR
jgi:molybdate transport system permease protein